MKKESVNTLTLAILLSIFACAPVSAEWIQWVDNGHYYEIRPTPVGLSFYDAHQACLLDGAYLATIASSEENDFVFSLANDPAFWFIDNAGNSEGPWLGGYQLEGSPEPGGGWQWATGEPWTFANWISLDNGSNAENTMNFFAFGSSGGIPNVSNGWNDRWGAEPVSKGYVCEREPDPTTICTCVEDVTDDFEDGDLAPLWIDASGPVGTVQEVDGKLTHFKGDGQVGVTRAVLDTDDFSICGDFEVVVDFDVSGFPGPSGSGAGRSHNMEVRDVTSGHILGGIARYRENTACGGTLAGTDWYVGYSASVWISGACPPLAAWHPTDPTDVSGKLRLRRQGSVVTAAYWDGAVWIEILNHFIPQSNEVYLQFVSGTSGWGTSSHEATFDNLQIQSDGECKDDDGDGVPDLDDNCPDDSNPDQSDNDLDGEGDACDTDDDNDTVLDDNDNCQFTANVDQIDLDFDGEGDPCDADVDGDGVCDDPASQIGCTGGPDNCPNDPNEYQTDTDGDGAGDECDGDDDNDGVCDTDEDGASCTAGPDNCPTLANVDQADAPDGDGIGDLCDADDDNDGTDDDDDNCPVTANPDQNDTDMDGEGDACDTDDDNDGVLDDADNCHFVSNSGQGDADGDGVGDACNDADDGDGDEWSDELDNCPNDPNSDQNDLDGDGAGDACDPDIDGDGVDNGSDLCAGTPLDELANPANGCTIAQLCPCDGPRGTNVSWKNHGKYVSCVAHAAGDFLDLGLITELEKGAIVSDAAQSECGKK